MVVNIEGDGMFSYETKFLNMTEIFLSIAQQLKTLCINQYVLVVQSGLTFCVLILPTSLLCPWNSLGKNMSGLPFPSPGGSSWPRDRTQISHTASRFFTVWATRKPCLIRVLSCTSILFEKKCYPIYCILQATLIWL